jgi:plasmid stabilization system protein ParE
MRKFRLLLSPDAVQDVQQAVDYYHSWKLDKGRSFWDLFVETLAWIEWNPLLFKTSFKGFRKALIRKSYYAIFYGMDSENIVVLAVFDTRRNPSWIQMSLVQHRKKK